MLRRIFLASQRKVSNLQMTTTEPIAHAFGTAKNWRQEFTINKFLTYCNKKDLIMKNVLENNIKTKTSQKGCMHGFQGFANVVKKWIQNLHKRIKRGKLIHVL